MNFDIELHDGLGGILRHTISITSVTLPDIICVQGAKTGSYSNYYCLDKSTSVPSPIYNRAKIKYVNSPNPVCKFCGGDLGGWGIGRLENHQSDCPVFPL